MIDMSMGEDHAVNFTALAKFAAVALERFFALALEQATVEHDFFAIHLDEMLRSGDSPGRAVESDLHFGSCREVSKVFHVGCSWPYANAQEV